MSALLLPITVGARMWVLVAAQTTPVPAAQRIEPDTFTSAKVCAECHQAIHAVWQESMHSRAYSNGVFQAAYQEARRADSQRAALCLECHAPTVLKTDDEAVKGRIINEGVTCDYCHSIRSVNLDSWENRADLHVGRTKYGPLKHAQSPAHQVVDSALHRGSELCATCHEYRNEHGVAILETYSEWKSSSYAEEGTQCQHCHMPLVPGEVVALKVKTRPREGINLHNISGSHDLERVRKAVTMEILSAVRLGPDKVRVRVSVSNVGSGHCFPTGLPMHRGILEVRLTDGWRELGRRTVEFEKVLLDERGMPITREHEAFLATRAIRNDSRLRPKEQRTISLTFENVDAPKCTVEASLSYQYSTRVLKLKDGAEVVEPMEMQFLLASARKQLPDRPPTARRD